jgi:WD40 repeat protein
LVGGFEELTDGNILSWSGDGTLRLWDRQSGQMMATLAGHTGWIWDAKELPDGRILSWSRDKTLRLWNRHSGQPMASIAAHTDWDRGFYVLADGKILCQSKDGNLRLRDDHTGELIGEPISEKELPWNNPQLLYRRAQAHSAKWTSGQTAAWSFGSTLGVAACTDQSYPACWQDDSPAQIHALLAAGVLILTLENNKLLCLQLYRGSERTTVKEYERDFRDKHEEAEVPQNIDCLSIPLTQGSDAAVARTFGG